MLVFRHLLLSTSVRSGEQLMIQVLCH